MLVFDIYAHDIQWTKDGKTEKLFSKPLPKAILWPDFPVAQTPHTHTFSPYTFPEQFIQGASESKEWYMEHRLLNKGEELEKFFGSIHFVGLMGICSLTKKK